MSGQRPEPVVCRTCGTPTSPWTCSCGLTRVGDLNAQMGNEPAPTQDAITRRKRWAYAVVRRAGADSPAYGTPGWLELPEDSPEKLAGVVRAAECWARDGDDLVENLRREVEAERLRHKRREDAEYVARREVHKARWQGLRVVRGGAWADTEEFRSGRWIEGMPRPAGKDGSRGTGTPGGAA